MVIHSDKVEGEVSATDFNELLGAEVLTKADLHFIHRWKEAFQVVRMKPVVDPGVPVIHIDDMAGYLIEKDIKANSPNWNILFNGIDGLDSGLIVCHGAGRPDEAGWGPIPVTWSNFEELLDHMHKVSIIKDWIEGSSAEQQERLDKIHSDGHHILNLFLDNYLGAEVTVDQVTLEEQWREFLDNYRSLLDTEKLADYNPEKLYQRLLDTTPWEQWPLRILDNLTAIRRTKQLAKDIGEGLLLVKKSPATQPGIVEQLHNLYDGKEYIPEVLVLELGREPVDPTKGWEGYFPQPKELLRWDRFEADKLPDQFQSAGRYKHPEEEEVEDYDLSILNDPGLEDTKLFTKQEVLRIVKALNPDLMEILPLLKRLG